MQAWPQREKGKDLFAGTQVKGAVTPEETETDMPLRVQGSGGGMSQQWLAPGAGALNTAVLGVPGCASKVFLKEVLTNSVYPYHSLASGQTTGREHSPTH